MVLDPDGAFTYFPPGPDIPGIDSFQYVANDGTSDSNAATVTILTTAANAPPFALPDSYAVAQDTLLIVPTAQSLLANDRDPEGHVLTAVKATDPANGTLQSFAATGVFLYRPDPGFSGTDTFTYVANDGLLDSPPATVSITVNAANRPPVANNDAYSVSQGVSLDVSSPGLLVNDTDADGDQLTAVVSSLPNDGGVTVNPDGSFTYTPDPSFTGTDSFTYTVNDGAAQSAAATVQLTVTAAPNRPPVANNDTYRTPQDIDLVVAGPGVLSNDLDPEGSALRISTIVSQPVNGVLSPSLLGGFTYTPNAGFTGTDSFQYRASDNQLDSNIATVQITVSPTNLPPGALDDSYTVVEGKLLSSLLSVGVLDNDFDPEGHALTAIKASDPSNGTLFTFDPDGSFNYKSNPGFVGTDSFTYVASDGVGQSNTATVTITVTSAVANLPPVTNNDAYSTQQDTVLNVAPPGVLDNDSDPEGGPLTASVVLAGQPTNGHLSPHPDGSFSYTPDPGFVGVDSFSYVATDDAGQSTAAMVQITVTAAAANLPPVANNDLYSTPQGSVLTVAAPGVLANDADPEGHVLNVTVTSQPTNGILAKNPKGGFSYTPNAGFSGTDSYTYTANDGSLDSNEATVRITVTATASNLPPVANGDAYVTPQDTVLTVAGPGLLANDADPEGQALRISTIETQPANGQLSPSLLGGFTYTPDPGFSGTDSFSYRASDNQLDSNIASVQITVTATASNLPPVANGDVYATPQDTVLNVAAPGVLANDADPEGHALTVTVTSQPANGALAKNPNGGFSYTPNAGFSGTDSYTYTANDGALDSNVATVLITVTAAAANLPPVANNDAYATPQDTVLNVAAPGVLGNDADPEGHALTVTVTSQPANGALAKNPNGGFSYTPNAGFSGTDSYTYTANDGALDSNVATVLITVTAAAANLPPVANNDAYATPQDTVLNVAAPGVLGNDADPEGHALTVTVTSQPANGALAKNPNGGFSYTPNAGFSGTDSYTYTANDGALDSNTATVQITVTGLSANQPPVANDDAYATPQDTVLNVAAPGILGNDSDPEGHALKLTVLTQPASGHLALTGDGGFSYTPDAGFFGVDSFTYRVNDGKLDSNTATVELTVEETQTASYVAVPTLSQWGMAIMALLMLGVGFVGFRRFC